MTPPLPKELLNILVRRRKLKRSNKSKRSKENGMEREKI
jgi:hypothetical protein